MPIVLGSVDLNRGPVGTGFDVLGRKVKRKANLLAYNAARAAEEKAVYMAPQRPATVYPPKPTYVRTNNLRNSIKAKKVTEGHWKLHSGANNSLFDEYGTRYMRAMPYFTPGIQAGKRKLKDDLPKVVR